MLTMEAIQSATVVSVKLLKAENEIGQLAPNFMAYIIAVNEEPIMNIKTLENVVFIIKNGIIFKN